MQALLTIDTIKVYMPAKFLVSFTYDAMRPSIFIKKS